MIRSNDKPAQPFSVLMSVYHGDVPEQLDTAIESIVNQTWPPDEIVLVEDGPITESLASVVDTWREKFPNLFRIVALPTNVGLGLALKAGIVACPHDIVARMDADDISVPERFEKQLRFLQENPDVDVVSSWTGQFFDDAGTVAYVRPGPTTHDTIAKLAKFRSPIGHGPAMYRRSAVLDAGNYSDWPGMEDYDLWVRMLSNGSRMACIPEPLYNVRRNRGLLKRRGGLRRAYLQILLQRQLLRADFITFPRFLSNITLRAIVALLPVELMWKIRIKTRI